MKDNVTEIEYMGDNHVGTSVDTPIREDAFMLNDDEKMKLINKNVHEIMEILGLDLTDDSLKGTPHRVSKCL